MPGVDDSAVAETSVDNARPRVVVWASMSVDGRVSLGRDRRLLDEENARRWRALHPPSADATTTAQRGEMTDRCHPEAVLEGSGSFVAASAGPVVDLPAPDDPDSVLYADFLPAEKLESPAHDSWFVVVDSRGRVNWTFTGAAGVDLLVLIARATPAAYLAFLRRLRVPYLMVGTDRVDLALALRRMWDRLGVTCLWSEAGGGLNGALLRARLVDEIHLTVLPAVIGVSGTPAIFDGPDLVDGEQPTRLLLLDSQVANDGLLSLRYEVIDQST